MIKSFHKGLVALADTMDIDLIPITQEWQNIYFKRVQSRGKADAVKFVKELNTVAERYALRQTVEPLPWTKSNSDGYPKILNKFKTYLRSKDSRKVLLTLSVFRTCELLRLPISKDISSITDHCNISGTSMQHIIDFIPKWVKRVKPLKLPKMKYHLSVKNGPNGHALKTSDLDGLAIMRTPHLYEAIRTVEDKLKDDRKMYEFRNEDINLQTMPIHSRLTQFPEKSGKTRTIAIIDYYSQRCLMPLHKGIMSILESLVSDGTYSHHSVGKFAQQKTKEKSFIYCADLSNATDRFPREIQRVLLFELIKDDDLSNALWTLLAERTFNVSWSDEQVTYSCGQPMGAYSSWPLFALAHHLVLNYCAYTVRLLQPYNYYRLIGDDVIITDEKLANAYQLVMKDLGLIINKGKTVCSTKAAEFSGAEVAKQLYLNGKCLTPLTPGFMRNIRKPYMFKSCMEVLLDRYEFFSTSTLPVLIDKFYKRKTRPLVWLLVSNPIDGIIKPGEPGYDDRSPWRSRNLDGIKAKYVNLLIDNILETASRYLLNSCDALMDGLTWSDIQENNITIEEIASRVGSRINPTSPEPKALRNVWLDIEDELTKLTMIDWDNPTEALEALTLLDYVPNPEVPRMERKELRHRRLSSVYEKLYNYDFP